FANRDDAESAFSTLVDRGLPGDQLHIFQTDSAEPAPAAPKEDSNAVLKDVVVDGAIGTAVGTGLGALAEVALVAANVTLFVASPLIAPLAMLGWGAVLGGVIGAVVGAETQPATAGTEKREGWLSALVRDAIASGQIVLVAQCHTEQQTAIAREVIQASVGDYGDDTTV
ncbi:MAG: hypothetical protein Q7T78_08860, partial [Rhodoferax sp.]|nr:hypothetical protein [Rhodoferax sp.]